jgi:hypothetical protein
VVPAANLLDALAQQRLELGCGHEGQHRGPSMTECAATSRPFTCAPRTIPVGTVLNRARRPAAAGGVLDAEQSDPDLTHIAVSLLSISLPISAYDD